MKTYRLTNGDQAVEFQAKTFLEASRISDAIARDNCWLTAELWVKTVDYREGLL